VSRRLVQSRPNPRRRSSSRTCTLDRARPSLALRARQATGQDYGPQINGELLNQLSQPMPEKTLSPSSTHARPRRRSCHHRETGLIAAAVKAGFTVNLSGDKHRGTRTDWPTWDRRRPCSPEAYARRAVSAPVQKEGASRWAETIGDWRDRTAAFATIHASPKSIRDLLRYLFRAPPARTCGAARAFEMP